MISSDCLTSGLDDLWIAVRASGISKGMTTEDQREVNNTINEYKSRRK